jgi:hypothetical protein
MSAYACDQVRQANQQLRTSVPWKKKILVSTDCLMKKNVHSHFKYHAIEPGGTFELTAGYAWGNDLPATSLESGLGTLNYDVVTFMHMKADLANHKALFDLHLTSY